ncbi:3-keto-5-aminohexanoate cleavage protein [Tunturiibacter gelidiferens]|uniref:3-keto-5-aminohexanoate cleavage protein n=1 Tax=Tunturiibacter gelidiferens TaxID=3069689 RepID=UPI003D9ACEC9
MLFIQAALNGDSKHPAVPRTANQIAQDAKAAAAAGAQSVHIHAFNDHGAETLDSDACARALRATRRQCPGIPISLTTSAAIVEDPAKRLAIISSWTELPDLVTANQGEEGIIQLCEVLMSRGVEIEAGLLSVSDAGKFVAAPTHLRWRRVLIEPLDADPNQAVRHAAEMEDIVLAAGITLEQVHHGYGIACWAVNQRAITRGYGIRTGLEDVAVLPDGRAAESNAQLVRIAVAMIATARLR